MSFCVYTLNVILGSPMVQKVRLQVSVVMRSIICSSEKVIHGK